MYRCPICGKQTKTLYGLMKHMHFLHARYLDPHSFYCPICGEIDEPLIRHCLHKAWKEDDLDHALIYCAMRPRGRNRPPTSEARKRITQLIRKITMKK